MAVYFRKEALPGIFIVCAAVLILFLVFSIKPTTSPKETYEVKVLFNKIAGLRENAAVWFAGVEKYQGIDVGRVKEIRIINSARINKDGKNEFDIQVTLLLNRQIPLKEGSAFRIASSGLAGHPHVEIIPGDAAGPDIPPDSSVRGNTPPDDLYTTLQELSGIVKSMELDKLSPKLRTAVEHVGELSEQLKLVAVDVRAIVHELRESGDLQTIVSNVRVLTEKSIVAVDTATNAVGDVKTMVGKVDTAATTMNSILDENRADIRQSITTLRTMTERTDQNLNETLTRLNALIGDIDTFLAENSDEIDSILVNLNATTQNIKLFTHDIKLNPWKLLMRSKERSTADMLQPISDKGVLAP
ncbi:MCE family protein [bacterium]|nr:MCE family protein [bacterium]